MTTCLLVDDDDELRELTGQRLASYGMTIRMARTGQSCHESLAKGGIDIVLLDLRLPDGDGIEVCRAIRRDMKVPVIMLTASSDPVSRILGLEMGADDYLVKPFEPRELLARIRAVSRRTTGALSMDPLRIEAGERPEKPAVVKFGDWRVDWRNRMIVGQDGVGYSLSNVEARLLAVFLDHPKQVLARQQLMELIQGADVESSARMIDLSVSRLRAKLKDPPDGSRIIQTVRGRGYILACNVE
jgi:two-component system, OmpR family, response regulator